MTAPQILSIAFILLLCVPVFAWIASMVTPKWLAAVIVLLGLATAFAWFVHEPEAAHDFPDLEDMTLCAPVSEKPQTNAIPDITDFK
jgi:hypothetical protein